MGDEADYYMDQMLMDDLYYSNVMYEEETNSYIPWRVAKVVKCKFCNNGPLKWVKMFDKWVLYENGKLHECDKYKLDLKKIEENHNKNKNDKL